MKISLEWLNEYVDISDLTVEEIVHELTMSGLEVEEIEKTGAKFTNIITAQIKEIRQHPNADKLHLVDVDLGNQVKTVVCGAQNIKEGQIIPYASVGSQVLDRKTGKMFTLTPAVIRGVESQGMLCSADELGVSERNYQEEDGILILNRIFPNVTIGENVENVLGFEKDYVLNVAPTANRGDQMSVIGVARELSAIFNKPLKFSPLVCTKDLSTDTFKVEIIDNDVCKYYSLGILKDIKIKPSPDWMQKRLIASGIRAINNVVDITNYVMLEMGQPMHAFDLDTVAGHKIVVKRAKDGDKFVTLDGQERTLDSGVLMICDGEKEIGIAGIMGGENSMVTDSISTLLFEAACFDGTNIRLASKRIGLRTDASAKFEKGLDPNLALEAINRACQLIEELGCGEVVEGVIDIYPNPVNPWQLPFEPEKMNKLLGMEIAQEQMLEFFNRLGLTYNKETNMLTIPTFRQDLHCMADLAEEVARLYGYDKLPATLPRGEATVGKKQFHMLVEDVIRNVVENNGFSGGMCYSFESPKVYDKLLIPEDSSLRNAIVIANPLGEDFSIMRTISLNGMITSLSTNYNRRNKDARLYELGNVYLPKALPLTELPEERKMLTLGMYGEGDFFTMKGVVEEIFDKLGIDVPFTYEPKGGYPFLHPGRQAAIVNGENRVGYLGQLHPQVVDNYDMKGEVYVAVLDLQKVTALASFDRKYEGIAKYPASTRDLSMVMDKTIFVGQIEEIIKKNGGKLLESYKLFDVYEGEQVGKGKKSVAYTMTFRAKDRNLEADEVNNATNKIIEGLKKLGIEFTYDDCKGTHEWGLWDRKIQEVIRWLPRRKKR